MDLLFFTAGDLEVDMVWAQKRRKIGPAPPQRSIIRVRYFLRETIDD